MSRQRNEKHSLKAKATSKYKRTRQTQATLAAATAANPVLFGDQTVESGTDSNVAGLAEAFQVSNAVNGTTASISVYVDSSSGAKTLYAGVYADNSGHPGSLVASGSLSLPKAAAWNNVTVPSAAVSAGKTYWIAVLGTGGTVRFRDRFNGPCVSETSYQSTLTSLPSSWKTGRRYTTCPVSAYVNGYLTTNSPTAPPTVTTLPAISGSTVQGQTLSTTNGSWTGSPTGYTYQWRQCDSSGNNCTNLSGATTSSYTLASSDVGHTMRVVVTASNAGGSTPATAVQTASVSASGGQTTNCAGTSGSLSYASMDACGYPSPNTTGPPSGTTFTAEPNVRTSDPPYNCPANGPCTINAVSSSGLTVNTKSVTIANSLFTNTGDTWAIKIVSGAANTTIKYTKFQGAGPSYPSTLTVGVYNQADNTLIMDHDETNYVDRILSGYAGATVKNSYCIENANIDALSAHYECVYSNGGPMVLDHDTLVNPHSQSANMNTDSGDTSNTIHNSLLINAPGPYIIDMNPGSNVFTNNRIARQVYGGTNLWHVGSSGASYSATGNVWDDTGTVADCSHGGGCA